MDGEGPEFSHTHEFSHHLQFLLGISSGIKSRVTKVAKERVNNLSERYSEGDEITVIVMEQKGKKVELATPEFLA